MEKLGRYRLMEIVGEGAMARVYRAHDPEIDRPLAVKLLKAHLASDEGYRARFLREAKGAGVLSHPNIVTIYDVGVDDGHPYIAEEFVEGLTLADAMQSGRKFSIREIVEIGIQLARALDYAHRKGIVHRDVKPGNIMLVANTTTVKVADFGICRIDSRGDTDLTQHTQLGDVLGTPNYMSPEQVLGQKVDSRSDLFSAGVVLYKLMTGALPFEGDSIITVAVRIAQSDPPAIETLRPDVPLSLRRVVDRALRKQPDKRYQTGEDLAQALIGVARELKEQDDARIAGRRIPLGVRWAAIMAALVGLTMLATATMLYHRQYQAMMDQVMGYGESLAKFMATQSAVPLLGEDWAAIEIFIQETMTRQNFPYLVVTDDGGIVRGSNDPAELGRKYAAPSGRAVATPDKTLSVQSLALADGRKVLDFRAPILFQGTRIGNVHLGILEEPMSRVARLILTLLAILTLVTVAAVALGVYLLARRLVRPIGTLKTGLDEIAAGRYDFRIAEERTDEFGELFKAYDRTAAALESRYDHAAAAPRTDGDGTIVVAGPAAAGAKVAT